MKKALPHLIDAFAHLKVIVLGEAILDSYLEGTSDRLCREAPVPVISLGRRQNAPGGAANTALNISSLGAHPLFLSVIGNDQEGALLQQALKERGLSTEHLFTQPHRRTLAKQRVMAGSHMVVRLDQGHTTALDEKTEQRLIDRLSLLFPRCDALIISDYNGGLLTPRIIQTIARLQRQIPRPLAIASNRLTAYRDVRATLVKPNYEELVRLLELDPLKNPSMRVNQLAACEEQISKLTNAQIVAVTLDQEGVLIFERGRPLYRTCARPTFQTYPAEADNTFISAFTLALAANASATSAAELASTAAGIVVGHNGAAACSAETLRGAVTTPEKYITNLSDLVDQVAYYRQQGYRIVLTNGCFDILHRGHITYLNRAKTLGNILILGLNSDEGIRRLKGPTRPINKLEDRAQVLAALNCVDHIIPFHEDTPCRLVRAIQPDVFVKGGDYTRATLPEAPLVEELGGVVKILPYLDNFSTSNIIERIQETYVWPGTANRVTA